MLTKEQKAFILEKLNSQYSYVELNCDGFNIHLSISRYKMRLVVNIYINGIFKGEWITAFTKLHPETKYLPIKKQHCYSPQRKANIIKTLGKRVAKKTFPNLDKIIEVRYPYFTSPKAALTHLIKVSNSIELLTDMTHANV